MIDYVHRLYNIYINNNDKKKFYDFVLWQPIFNYTYMLRLHEKIPITIRSINIKYVIYT